MADWKWDETRQSWRKEVWINGDRTQLRFKGAKKDALLYEAQRRLELEVSPKGAAPPCLTAPAFSDFCLETYAPHAKATLRPSTYSIRRYRLATLQGFFADTRLDQITTAQIEAFKQARTTGAGSVDKVTCNGELNDLSAILAYAKHLKLPVADVTIKRYTVRKRKGSAKPYTRAEVGFILAGAAAVAPGFHALVKFLAETGCRRSEGVNLPKARLDLAKGMARIWSDASGDAEDGDDEYEVKSSDREVTLPDGLVLVLKAHLKTTKDSPWVFPVAKGRSVDGERTREPGDKYTEWPKHLWRHALKHANALAKSADRKAREIDGGPHRLRHTFASLFLAGLPDLFALAKVLGHSHTRVTELYSHLLPDHLATTRNVVTFDAAPSMQKTPSKTPSNRRAPALKAG